MFLKNSRLDIYHVVSLMFRYMSAPFEIHLKVAKWILRYVKGILDFGIHYLKNKAMKLIRYSDSDWVHNIDDQKSTFGNYFNLGFGLVT